MYTVFFVCMGIIVVIGYFLMAAQVVYLYEKRDPVTHESRMEHWFGESSERKPIRAMLVTLAPVTLAMMGWMKAWKSLHHRGS